MKYKDFVLMLMVLFRLVIFCTLISFVQRYTLVIDTKQQGETHIYFIWTDEVER